MNEKSETRSFPSTSEHIYPQEEEKAEILAVATDEKGEIPYSLKCRLCKLMANDPMICKQCESLIYCMKCLKKRDVFFKCPCGMRLEPKALRETKRKTLNAL